MDGIPYLVKKIWNGTGVCHCLRYKPLLCGDRHVIGQVTCDRSAGDTEKDAFRLIPPTCSL